MDYQTKYNTKIPAVKRLMLEACELKEPTEDYSAYPLEDNLFEWHFTVRGADGTDFENGFYHGRIILPNEYPMKPPNIILLTPNGRFEVNKKICLSISGHHPETWIPSWSIRTALLALIAFLPTPGKGTLGSLDYTPQERRQLAAKSRSWKCPKCGVISEQLSRVRQSSSPAPSASTEASHLTTIVSNDKGVVEEELTNSLDEPREPAAGVDLQTDTVQVCPQTSVRPLLSTRTCDLLIVITAILISFLIYRRLFLI